MCFSKFCFSSFSASASGHVTGEEEQCFWSALPALHSDKLSKSLEKLDTFHSQTKCPTAQVRVSPKGESAESYQAFAWVPASLKTDNHWPENLPSFGAPWLLRNQRAAWRHGPASIPCWGLGQILLGVKGSVCLMAWDMSRFVDLAMPPAAGFEYLAGMPH